MVPVLDVPANTQQHRSKHAPMPIFSAMIHRLLMPQQVKTDLLANKDLTAEANKHQECKAWYVNSVREATEVMAESRSTGVPVHFGQDSASVVSRMRNCPQITRYESTRVVMYLVETKSETKNVNGCCSTKTGLYQRPQRLVESLMPSVYSEGGTLNVLMPTRRTHKPL